MTYKRRRLGNKFMLGGAALLLGVGVAVAAAVGDSERVDSYWTSAVVDTTGEAQVAEVIDYEFGRKNRRGIFRDVPRLDPAAPVFVESPSAPDEFLISERGTDTRIRIGDPDQTINGRHRYRIEYPIDVGLADGRISWDAVGTRWNVAIHNIEIHLATDRELSDVRCSQGKFGSWDRCEVIQPEPGRVVVTVDKLDSFQGVTVSAVPGRALAEVPALPAAPTGRASDPGTGMLPPALTAAGVALLAAAAISMAVRRAGQEFVWAGGSADAAFGPQHGEDFPVRRVDHDELNAMASTEFAPPKGLTAWQGGVLYAELANRHHQVAWLLERAIAGEIEIEGEKKDLSLRLLSVDSPEQAALSSLFGGRGSVKLGKYDKQFAGGWNQLHAQLDDWHQNSTYWDPAGDRKRRRAMVFGLPLWFVGLVVAGVSAIAANRAGPFWLIAVAFGAAMTGAGFSLMIRRWELRVRTPQGSGLWILTESFRRFIHNSDAQHVDAAAKKGVLLDYTAWAVALGEVDRWTEAVKEADVAGSAIGPQALYMTAIASNLGSAVATAATTPSSSGSGGGSVGGGGGGGGGGSW